MRKGGSISIRKWNMIHRSLKYQHFSFFLIISLWNNKKDVLLHRFCVTAYDGKEPR